MTLDKSTEPDDGAVLVHYSEPRTSKDAHDDAERAVVKSSYSLEDLTVYCPFHGVGVPSLRRPHGC